MWASFQNGDKTKNMGEYSYHQLYDLYNVGFISNPQTYQQPATNGIGILMQPVNMKDLWLNQENVSRVNQQNMGFKVSSQTNNRMKPNNKITKMLEPV